MQRLVRNLILPCLLCTPVIANAVSWTEAIASVQNDADQYHDYAVEVGGTSWAGSMYNGYKYDEHRCAILGRMLGLHSFIHHIEEFDYPPMGTRSDPHDLLVFAISLRNWVGAARWAVAAHDTERKSVWNLDCVGHFGIAKSAYVENAAPNAEFEIRGAQLHVYGDIEAGFAKRFIETLNSHPEIEEIALGSAGGSVADAIFAGLAIRHRGLSTTIYGNCYSACR